MTKFRASHPGVPWLALRSRLRSESRSAVRRRIILLAANILALIALLASLGRSTGWPPAMAKANASPTPTQPAATATQTATFAPSLTAQPTAALLSPTPNEPTPTSPDLYPLTTLSPQPNLIILSLSEDGYHHLFAYHPLYLPLTRLTNGAWHDINPAISPDGQRLAFASNRAKQWDLYVLDLTDGSVIQLTDTPDYDAAPSWSPDSNFIVYESFVADNLEILIRSLTEEQMLINLSQDPAADLSPAWSPQGRQIAFVSLRNGDREVWLADLDKAGDERFTNLSRSPLAAEAHPTWLPAGGLLSWSSVENGFHNLYVWQPGSALRYLGSGDWPAWSPDGAAMLTAYQEPNQTLLTAYKVENSLLALPPVALPGSVAGLVWTERSLPDPLPESLDNAARLTPTSLWMPALSSAPDVPNGRQHLVTMADIQAPYPQLHDLVDESYLALRARVASEAGWDLLASLENAYVPLTAPLAPGLGNDWLYTGRAFAFNPTPISAGWLVAVPEQYGPQTYWRIYLRARFQDGSQGAPLHDLTWDLDARYDGKPLPYEQGGALSEDVPAGYWVDLTELASAYGWERLPALSNWRSFYPAARFNEFVHRAGLDWQSAMLELYPPEALITPTIVLPPTPTPLPTSRWYRTPTPSPTSTPRPTLTPLPTATPQKPAPPTRAVAP